MNFRVIAAAMLAAAQKEGSITAAFCLTRNGLPYQHRLEVDADNSVTTVADGLAYLIDRVEHSLSTEFPEARGSMLSPGATFAMSDLATMLVEFTPGPVFPCPVCGAALTVDSPSVGTTAWWGCSSREPDPDEPGCFRRKPGRESGDQHYQESLYFQKRKGDARIVQVLGELLQLRTLVAGLEQMAARWQQSQSAREAAGAALDGTEKLYHESAAGGIETCLTELTNLLKQCGHLQPAHRDQDGEKPDASAARGL